ncbi:MAG: hypothetical protein ACREAN_00765, partial [Nitrosopumilaceae archaeon]
MGLRRRAIAGISILIVLIVVVSTVAIGGVVVYYFSPLSATSFSRYCTLNKNINVNITSFEVDFVYTGSSKGYLETLSQTPDRHFDSSANSCPLYFVDAVVISGVNGSSHIFSNLSLFPSSFVFANDGGFSGPQTANEVFPSFTIAYVANTDYTGPLV